MARKRIARRVEQALELPEGMLTSEARMEVYGNKRVMIEGNCSIVEYETDVIRLNTESGIVRFMGRDLCLSCLTRTSAVVTGQILSVEFV